MKLKTRALLAFALLTATGCMERKTFYDDAASSSEAGVLDSGGKLSVDASNEAAPPAIDSAGDLAILDASAAADVGVDVAPSPTDSTPSSMETPPSSFLDTGSSVDVLPAVLDATADVSIDAPADAPGPGPDGPGACPSGQKVCGATCIATAACCASSDCPGTCQICNTSHACVAATSQDDPNGRCAGTCDATGTCKSKKGQTCQTVTGGCATGTFCAPDGICCDTACTGSCQACDIPGFLGTCTPVASGNPHGNRTSCGTDATCAGTCAGKADGTCSYPTKNCGAGPSCSGSDKVIAQSTCVAGACQTPAATACQGGFACTAAACNTTCQTNADCAAGNYCDGSACVAKKANGQPCTSATADTCYSGICGSKGTCCFTDCGLCGTCSTSGTACNWQPTAAFCGTKMVCDSSHACVACDYGAACVSSSNECQVGTIDCKTGGPTCSSLHSATEGTTCNNGAGYCGSGVCTAKGGPGATCYAGFWCISGQCVSDTCL